MADEQARPEVIQEEEDESVQPEKPADGANEQTNEAQQEAEQTADGGGAADTGEEEGTKQTEGVTETEQVKEGEGENIEKEEAIEKHVEGDTAEAEQSISADANKQLPEEKNTDSEHQNVDNQASQEQTTDKQVSEAQDIDKQASGEQAVDKESAEEPSSDKQTSEEQATTDKEPSDKPASGDEATDKEASGEQTAETDAAHEQQSSGEVHALEAAGDDEKTLPAEGEEKTEQAEGEIKTEQAEGEEGTGSPKPEGEGEKDTPKPEGEGEGEADGMQLEAGEEDKKDVPGEGAVEGDAGEEGVQGEHVAEGEAAEEDAMKTIEEKPGNLSEIQEEEPTSPIPQNEAFTEGEREDSPIAIGERLSRESTPPITLQRDGTKFHSPPEPGTPREEEQEETIEQPEFNREQLIEKYHQALSERQQLQEQNYQLQNKLAEYFRKKKSEDIRQETNVTDQEQRYLKYMANLDELRRQDIEERELYKQQIEELKEKCDEKQKHVDEETLRFLEYKRQIAMGSVNSRSGRPIPLKDIEQYLSMESKKEADVVNVRLENIKLRNKLRKKEQALKSKEELAEGLHLIDFEQLKIENQTYNEKIEERNEELLKLRKKITSTVQVLTHLKEKLQFVQAENQVQQGILHEVEETAAKKRDILSRTKQARDALRIDNQKLRQNCGLLGNEPLLRDFEERKDESEALHNELERLKMMHAELTLNLNGVRKKIEQAQANHQ